MRRIVLVRHATAVDVGPEGSDFHRRLRKRGLREAAVMAGRTGQAIGTPDLMLTSSAARALETARIFAARFGYPEDHLVLRDELYGGLLPEDFLRIVSGLPPRHHTVLFFGHDPSFTEFAAFLDPEFRNAIPKAGVVILDVGDTTWRRVRPGGGHVVLFEIPPEPPKKKRAREDVLARLGSDIETGILRAAARSGVPGVPAVVRAASGASQRLAKVLSVYAGSSARGAGKSPAPKRARPSSPRKEKPDGKRGRR